MRRALWWPALGACVFLNAQLLIAQPSAIPPVGTIDFYGLETISKSEVRELLPIQEGFDFTGDVPSSDTVAAEMAEALGVARVVLNVICCSDDGLSQLYVGVDESAKAISQYYRAPAGDVRLPPDVVDNFDEFLDRMMAGVIEGNASEDHSQGHALADAVDVRRTQEIFIEQARQQLELMIDVLEHSSDARHRSIAAHVLGYAPDKSSVAPILATAVLDPDEGVRNYATRSLAVIAEFANANPDLGIVIPSEPFIEMLNSIVWSDRNKSLGVLSNLTESRDADLLDALRRSALVSLREMCEWKHWGHALPACLILQRIVGLPDDHDERSRDSTLARAATLSDNTVANDAVKNAMNADAEAVADALWFAAADGDLKRFIRLTASAGPEVRAFGAAPTSALWIASQEGHAELVDYLLALGADFEATDTADGRTPLFQASQEGHAEIVSLLLEEGAHTETPSRKTGATPLFIASAQGHAEIVRLLLAVGARPDVTASAGDRVDTPLSIAELRGHTDVVLLLEEQLH